MLLNQLQDMRLTLGTRAYALGGMQAICKHIGGSNPPCGAVGRQYLGLMAPRGVRLPGTLKIRHVGSPRTRRPAAACQIAAAGISQPPVAAAGCRLATRCLRSIRSRADTPRRPAPRQTTFSSNSLTGPAAQTSSHIISPLS